jgi:hypothetical protein
MDFYCRNSLDIGIKTKIELDDFKNKLQWLYNVCEVLDFVHVTGRRLAELSSVVNNSSMIHINASIEVNAVLLTVLNYFDSFDYLFLYGKKNKPKKSNLYRLSLNQQFSNPTYILLDGLRNTLTHRHPINMRNVKFFGIDNRMGLALSPYEFNYDEINIEPFIIENSKEREKIKFIRQEPFDPGYSFFGNWFAWDHGKTFCYLDCEDLGKGIFDFMLEMLIDVIIRNEANVVDLLRSVKEIGNLQIYLKENDTHYHGCEGFHVIKPYLHLFQRMKII